MGKVGPRFTRFFFSFFLLLGRIFDATRGISDSSKKYLIFGCDLRLSVGISVQIHWFFFLLGGIPDSSEKSYDFWF